MTLRGTFRGHTFRWGAFTLIELLVTVAIIAILAGIAVPNFLEAQVRSKVSRTRSDMAVIEAAIRAYHADHNAYPENNPSLRDMLTSCAAVGSVTSCDLPTPAGAPAEWVTPDQARDACVRSAPAPAPPDDPMMMGGMMMSPGFGPYGGPQRPPLRSQAVDLSGNDLSVLTTPVAYFGVQLPTDVFDYQSRRGGYNNSPPPPLPFMYLHFPKALTGADGTRWMLLSSGPNRNADIENPLKGPWLRYDPTNGTVSAGDIFLTGGKPPEATEWGIMTRGAPPPLPGSPDDNPTTCSRKPAYPGAVAMPGMPGFGISI